MKQIGIIGNFKYLLLFILFSCQNKEQKKQLGKQLIIQNFSVLLDHLDYFKLSGNPLDVSIYQYVGEIKADQEAVIKKFQDKFQLSNEKIDNDPIKLAEIPQKKIGEHRLFLNSDNTFKKRNDIINVSFVNLVISKNSQYAAVEVVKSLGSGAKYEIYYFKQVNDKWVFEGKELLALG